MAESEMIERRAGWGDFSALMAAIHQLETRVAVLEARAGAQDDRLVKIETDLKEAKAGVQTILESLQEHMLNEEKRQGQLLRWTVSTLLAVIAFATTTAIQYFLR